MGSSQSTPEQSTPVQQPTINAELDKPWRKFDWGKKKELKEKLENFSQSHPDVKDIKILVAGQIGAGKSSFINSVDSAFQGRISSRALVNSAASDYSFTKNAGISQVVVMIKVDEACPLVKKDLRKVYTSKKMKEKMELCSAKVGVLKTNIFPVKNYHDEIDTEDDMDVLILKGT
ncbi:interferon-induced 44-like protein [Labeo rohita]|uniref:Interferon-induced 44-like protein n=1 Tax=Labeo rohita TaxID=84645 RepID=A0A498MWY1_LABRO|nr:interferon-induced 44-like protein [Labeo rohita]RXN24132.1 interferon-induced 44-like protein [Labeo rohita]